MKELKGTKTEQNLKEAFAGIKEVDAEGHEWWNSRKLALKVALKVAPKVSSMFGLKSKYVRIRILPQKNWPQASRAMS